MADMSVEILKSIRDELRGGLAGLGNWIDGLGTRIDETNVRLGETNERLDRLERRQTATEVRLATELTEVAKLIASLRDAILEDRVLRAKVDDHESRIRALETA